ncbi:alpha/beta fold hydrolase [Rhodococcus spelaei]|uniref:Alpha/beta fold hydrolase n=1 Tax=Rhodococcus spelaei TaxID=2546320 RepID=A0A541BMX1_9NOCA|nr:alpha/beta fold hydrolase [Rhodococcus spelaei]TQF73672.1 alpha/beta fold hydrolase [Rhodococcus spelaei]
MAVVADLEIHRYGPVDGPPVLALHGMTGHGQRWQHLADGYLPQVRMLAPDLRGHGRSTWAPPWSIDNQVDSLVELLEAEAREPVVLVGHSFGGTIALHLAARAPERVRALLLLDPAMALDPAKLLEIADLTVRYPDYTDAAEARSEKVHGAWADVPDEVLDAEIAEHLIQLEGGRVGWRYAVPAVVASWGELARPIVVPPADLPTVLVQAMRVQPPYVSAELRGALTERLGDRLTVVEMDVDHMVAQSRPAEVAALIEKLL